MLALYYKNRRINPNVPSSMKRKWSLTLVLCMAIMFGVVSVHHVRADDSPLVITVENNSGFEDTQVYLLCTGSNQPGDAADDHFGYLDFSNHTFVETGPKNSFALDASKMTATLNTIKGYSGDNTYKIQIPKIVSGRLYFAFGDNFDQCPSFSASGPPNGANNAVVYDKVEFDTWSNPNINITKCDIFGTDPSVYFDNPNVTLTFNSVKGDKSVIFVSQYDDTCSNHSPCCTSIQAAIDTANTGTAIKIAQGFYDESFVLNESKSLTLEGGWDSSFSTQTSNTTFIKTPKATQGSLTLQIGTHKTFMKSEHNN